MLPHMKDWKAWAKPRGTGIPLIPSILRPGMTTNPAGQDKSSGAGVTDPAEAWVVPGATIAKGSGLVVEEVFQRMPHLPFSVRIQLV